MKHLLTLLCFFSLLTIKAQEKKTETKEERQQRYINEVNPFRQFGYTPKIGTLSNGKYREAYPDTIVQIGSFSYNKLLKQVVGVIETDESQDSEATLKPHLASRWFSPDPLSSEYPSWSPYNFTMNNPIMFTDPTGLAPEWKPDGKGNLIAEKGDNAQTLAEAKGYSDPAGKGYHKALAELKEGGYQVNDQGILNLKVGDVLNQNNVMTRGLANSKGVTPLEAKEAGNNDGINPATDGYFCDDCAQMVANNLELNPQNAKGFSQFTQWTKGYTQVDNFNGVEIGKGIAIIRSDHVVSNYVKGSDGTQYVFSKDGYHYKPTIYTMQGAIDAYNKREGTKFTKKDVRYFKKDE